MRRSTCSGRDDYEQGHFPSPVAELFNNGWYFRILLFIVACENLSLV